MRLSHTVRIHVARPEGAQQVVQSSLRRFPRRLLRFLFGDCSEILVLRPGESVRNVEIRETKAPPELSPGESVRNVEIRETKGEQPHETV